tara:strand:- start:2530 stop:3420 length:891 start_codon:yes stop_codon:yes gene_type:complete
MELQFLGTSAMVPTSKRNHTSIFIKYKSHNILVDCGEGTQRQLKIAKIPLPSITMILITHWDGDHILGIPGLIQSIAASQYTKTLKIFGPKGTKSFYEKLASLFNLKNKIKVEVQDVSSQKFFENEDFFLESLPVNHTQPSICYNFNEKDKRKVIKSKMKKLKVPQGPLIGKLVANKSIVVNGKTITPNQITEIKKGKKITCVLDTKNIPSLPKFAKNADVLVCESTYLSDLEDRASKYKHMTALQAAQVAKKANVNQLILTHFSARYKDSSPLEIEAKSIFKNTKAAEDFLKINI